MSGAGIGVAADVVGSRAVANELVRADSRAVDAMRCPSARPGQLLRLHSVTSSLASMGLCAALGAFVGSIIGLYLAVMARAQGPLWGCVAIGFVVGVVLARARLRDLHVGADGLCRRAATRLGADFIPYREIAGFTIRTHGRTSTLLLHLRTGPSTSLLRSTDRARVVAIRNLLRATVASMSQQPAAVDQDALLPNGLDFDGWMTKLRALAVEEDAYRSARITDASALAVARSAGAPTLARLGAAVLLSLRGERAARSLDDAANDLADPALRGALRSLSSGAPKLKALHPFFLSELARANPASGS